MPDEVTTKQVESTCVRSCVREYVPKTRTHSRTHASRTYVFYKSAHFKLYFSEAIFGYEASYRSCAVNCVYNNAFRVQDISCRLEVFLIRFVKATRSRRNSDMVQTVPYHKTEGMPVRHILCILPAPR